MSAPVAVLEPNRWRVCAGIRTILRQSFAADQRACASDRPPVVVEQFLMDFDQRSTAFDHNPFVGCVVIPVQDKSCPYSDPAGARSLYDNILGRLRPTPDTITR